MSSVLPGTCPENAALLIAKHGRTVKFRSVIFMLYYETNMGTQLFSMKVE